ncbi:hypothetical protein GQ457_01G027460 [Hibiscus cannabinus]
MLLTKADVACPSEFFLSKNLCRRHSAVGHRRCPLHHCLTDFARLTSEHHKKEVNRSISSLRPPLSVAGTATESDMQGHEWYRLLFLFQTVNLLF